MANAARVALEETVASSEEMIREMIAEREILEQSLRNAFLVFSSLYKHSYAIWQTLTDFETMRETSLFRIQEIRENQLILYV